MKDRGRRGEWKWQKEEECLKCWNVGGRIIILKISIKKKLYQVN